MKTFLIFIFLTTTDIFSSEVRIYGDDSEKPKIYLNKADRPSGHLIEILHYIERNSDLEFKIELLPWSRAYKNALDGKGGVVGISKSKERSKYFLFTDEVLTENVLLVGNIKEKNKFKDLNSLHGKTVGITRGGYYGSTFSKLVNSGKIKTVELSNASQRLAMLLRGRIEWAVIGSGIKGLESALNKLGVAETSEVFIAPQNLLRDQNFIGFTKSLENKQIIDKVNKALRSSEGKNFLKKYRD